MFFSLKIKQLESCHTMTKNRFQTEKNIDLFNNQLVAAYWKLKIIIKSIPDTGWHCIAVVIWNFI